jgi:hypothetical protein
MGHVKEFVANEAFGKERNHLHNQADHPDSHTLPSRHNEVATPPMRQVHEGGRQVLRNREVPWSIVSVVLDDSLPGLACIEHDDVPMARWQAITSTWCRSRVLIPISEQKGRTS